MKEPRAILFDALPLLLAALFTALPPLAAQERPALFGIHGGAGLNTHTGNFNGFTGTARCGSFTNGTGAGWYAGPHAEIPLGGRWALEPRLTLSTLDGTLTAPDGFLAALPPDYSTVAQISTEHTLRTHFTQIALEALVAAAPVDFPLELHAGAEAGYVFHRSFTQEERVVSPAGIAFGTNKQMSGNLPASAFRAALLIGASWRFRPDAQWSVAPELFAGIPLTSVGTGLDWRISTLRAGVSVDFNFLPPAVAPPETSAVPPPPPEPPVLVAGLKARSVTADGSTSDVVAITVEETQTTDMFPLLPYIFFGGGSSRIPESMRGTGRGDSAATEPRALPRESMALYRHMLDIVGARLRKNPRATVTLTGFAGSSEEERSDPRLPIERAEAVQKYFSDAWGIDPKRMRIARDTAVLLPASPEAAQLEEEARRVIISSPDYDILAPIIIDDVERSVTPPQVQFFPEIVSQAGLAAWSIEVVQGAKRMKEFRGSEFGSSAVEWDLAQGALPAGEEPIRATLAVRDRAGQIGRAEVSIPVRQLTVTRKREERVGNIRRERYRLILFGYDSAELGPVNERIMAFIRERLAPGASVRIDGYTDHVGSEEHNIQLSSARASSVRAALGPDVPEERIEVRANGESDLFDNALPEGRYFCRTVHITVETPAQ